MARTLFRQWRRLAGRSGRISILLWIADGSEILEYTGNPADTFEWGYWQGIANPMPMPENPSRRLSATTISSRSATARMPRRALTAG